MSAELGSTKDYRFFLSYSRRDAVPETKAQQAALEALLRTTFSRTWTSKDVYFQHSVQSEQQLREVLTAAIEEVRRRIADRGRLLRGDVPVSDEPFPKLPTAGSSATAAAAGVQ